MISPATISRRSITRRTAPAPTEGAGSRPSGGTIGENFPYYLRQEKRSDKVS